MLLKCFWNYFTSENEGAEPPSVDIGNQFIQLLEDEDEAAQYLITLQTAHKLKPIQKILDHTDGTELVANLFRITQTDKKLLMKIFKASKARQAIQEFRGTLYANLTTPIKVSSKFKKEIRE